ncbi:MAG: hypothetical protein JWL83_3125 [Actinomycetia bacterium]|nr:hypothetical protein [Actinomycetes bacterium]
MPIEIVVTAWADPVVDTLGHDPRSWYAETFWLPTLGPTSLLLLRHLADRFDRSPDGCELVVSDTAAALGLGTGTGENAPLMRSLGRLVQFDLACRAAETKLAVRRYLPPVNRRHVRRLPVALQARHEEWVNQSLDTSALDLARRRARRVAFTLYELGDDLDAVERALHTAGFPAPLCRDAAVWAHRRHRDALAALAADAAS